MATRAEQFRAREERKGSKGKVRATRTKPGIPKKLRATNKKHAAKKATHALEVTRGEEARPSRISTRASANRAKPDTNFNLREEMQKGSPASRARRSRAKSARARGGGAK